MAPIASRSGFLPAMSYGNFSSKVHSAVKVQDSPFAA